MVVFVLIVCNPRILAPSLMPSKDTPSVVAKQSFDSESIVYSLPKLLHIICKHATPHCIESCWGVNGKLFFILNINHFLQALSLLYSRTCSFVFVIFCI